MKKSGIIIFGLAGLAFLLTFSVLTGIISPKSVVVVKYDLAAGTRLSADLVEVVRKPGAAVPEGAFDKTEDVVGMVLTTSRVGGDILTPYVIGESAASGIPAELQPNHVAIGVKVDRATGLAGVVRPGQRVSVIAIVNPQAIAQSSGMSNFSTYALQPTTTPFALMGPDGLPLMTTPLPTATPTATPEPPPSPMAAITIHGLRVLVVPQSFRYEEVPAQAQEDGGFAAASSSETAQSGSVILLEASLDVMQIAPGLRASPAELLALLNDSATLHLVLEPTDGVSVSVQSLSPVDLADLYERITGYDLNK